VVVAGAAVEPIVAGVAIEGVVAVAADDDVVGAVPPRTTWSSPVYCR